MDVGQAHATEQGFNETIRAHARRDPKFRNTMLRGAIETMLAEDIAF